MADAEVYTFAQREAGAVSLAKQLTDEGFKVEVVAERGKTAAFDSVKVRVMDKAGVASGDLALNAKGFINLAARYTDGDQKIIARVIAAIADLDIQESPVSEKFVKTKASPGAGGGSFLSRLS